MKCPKCGYELAEGERFCGKCGNQVDFDDINTHHPKRKKFFFVILSILMVVICIIAVIIFGGIKFENTVVEKTDSEEDSSSYVEEPTIQKQTALDFLEEVKKYYRDAEQGEIELNYKYVDGDRLFEYDKFENLLLGHIIADFNNDGEDDIFTLTLEKTEENESSDLKIFSRIYLWQADSTFKEFGTDYSSLKTDLGDHISYRSEYAMIENVDSRYNFVETVNIDNDKALYDENTYYSLDSSQGKHITRIMVHKVANKGFLYALGVERTIDHMMGMPEAEHNAYYMELDESSSKNLYSGGIRSITTGGDLIYPILEGTVTGSCQSEEDACSKINEQLTNLNLADLSISKFDWNSRYSNSFILSNLNIESISVSHSVSEDDDSGTYTLQIEKGTSKTTEPTENEPLINNINQYLGTWSSVDSLGQGFTVTISSISDSELECYLSKTSPNANHIAMTGKISAKLSEDNTFSFEFEDSFMNSGSGELKLDNDTIRINATIIEFNQPYVYALEGEGVLAKISDSTESPYH